ncbi:phage tail assembly protein [uncultured Helicobacter sp.]|uniref:phage tail assembly protein n=1 Tax=uncultured Helicobacter sp. TaxID=175537 RepID=UPI002600945B|nr:phage tail assembly protein [uncultured Helicobacter sp.]
MLNKIATTTKTFRFRDGQEVILKEPTLLQIQKARSKSTDEIATSKALLIDMSDGELTNEILDSLPLKEFKRLSEEIGEFVGIDEGN